MTSNALAHLLKRLKNNGHQWKYLFTRKKAYIKLRVVNFLLISYISVLSVTNIGDYCDYREYNINILYYYITVYFYSIYYSSRES